MGDLDAAESENLHDGPVKSKLWYIIIPML